MGQANTADPDAPPPGRIKRLLKRLWWFHSFFALFFGVGVMLFARAGLAHADKVMMALFISWLLMFVALRFVVGPANRKEQEGIARKGVRVATNYVIKQFFQQMFFFLTPLYASSATWSLSSFNWWIAPLLLVCAVISTMDLVFDNFIMERRWLVSGMYGLAMFGVLNVVLPLVVGLDHLNGLFLAALATPISVALLSFSARQVFSPTGALFTVAMTIGLFGAVYIGRTAIPPAPLAMAETAVGHGPVNPFECLPPSKHAMRAHQLEALRCGSMLREPGGLKERVVHAWSFDGHELAREEPREVPCDGDDVVFVSQFPLGKLPADPAGKWACTTYTLGGQLVGVRKFEILKKDGSTSETPAPTGSSGGGSGAGTAAKPPGGGGTAAEAPGGGGTAAENANTRGSASAAGSGSGSGSGR